MYVETLLIEVSLNMVMTGIKIIFYYLSLGYKVWHTQGCHIYLWQRGIIVRTIYMSVCLFVSRIMQILLVGT